MKKFYLIIMILMLTAVFTACELAKKSAPEEIKQIRQDNTTWVIEKDGLRVLVRTDDYQYAVGDRISLHVDIRNIGENKISYTRETPCASDVKIFIDVTGKDSIELNEENFNPRACIEMIDNRAIVPEQKIERDVVWDQKLPTIPDRVQVKPGIYIIQTHFTYRINDIDREILLKSDIEILETEGEGSIVSKEEATRTVFSNEEVLEWYDMHKGEKIIVEEFGKYYIINKAGRDRISDAEAKEIMESVPLYNIYFKGNAWEFYFSSKYGDSPTELIIYVDAMSGEITEIKKIGAD
ncbi:MAG: hypothetical protein KKF44_06480 [Nanoarchaeota archaeon]|nr:hypothetical protein [Nanoarchaeota archaeon]